MNSLRNRKNALPLVSCIDNLWTFNWVMPQILWLQILAWFLPAIEITAWSLHHVPFHFILFSSPTSFLTLHLLSISWNILVATRIPNNRKYEASQQHRYILALFPSFSICPLVCCFTGSTNRTSSKAMPNTKHGQWLLLVLQEGKGCFSLLSSASALLSLQGPVYQFALGNQMLQSNVTHRKRKFTIDVTRPLNHRSGKYPPRSWYNVKFTGAWIFHAVLSLKG